MHPQSNTPPLFGDTRLPARFWAKVRIGSIPALRPELGPCWEWTARRNNKGYGMFGVGSRTDGSAKIVSAHKLAYETLIGPIPNHLESDHLCRNRGCVRPGHIEPVTHAVNCQRSPLSARPSGEASSSAKLSEAQVQEIRRLRGKVSQRKLAARFAVGKSQIGAIQRGEWWQHLL